MRRYALPALAGALVAFLVRYLTNGDAVTAGIGAVVVLVVCAVLVRLGRRLGWQDSPMLYAGVATVASTLAFLLTSGPR